MTGNNRIWILVTALLAIGIVAIGWLVGVSPQLTAASASDDRRVQVDALNDQKLIETETLKADSANLDAIQKKLAEVQAQVPSTADYAAFLSELNRLASDHSVEVANLALGPAVLLPTAEAAAGTTAATTATPAPAATAAAVDATAVVPAGSVVAIPTTVTLSGSFADIRAATGALQSGARLFVVSGLDFANASGGSDYTVVVKGDLFVLTDGSTLITSDAAGAATGTPAPSPSPASPVPASPAPTSAEPTSPAPTADTGTPTPTLTATSTATPTATSTPSATSTKKP